MFRRILIVAPVYIIPKAEELEEGLGEKVEMVEESDVSSSDEEEEEYSIRHGIEVEDDDRKENMEEESEPKFARTVVANYNEDMTQRPDGETSLTTMNPTTKEASTTTTTNTIVTTTITTTSSSSSSSTFPVVI